MDYRLTITSNKNTAEAYKIRPPEGVFPTKEEAIKVFSDTKQALIKAKVPELLWPVVTLTSELSDTNELIEMLGGPLTTEEAAKNYIKYIEYTVSPVFEPWEMESEDLPGFRNDAARMGYFPEGFRLSDYNRTTTLDYNRDAIEPPKRRKRTKTTTRKSK